MKTCNLCDKELFGIDLLTKHFENEHPGKNYTDHHHVTFDWITVWPGLDHYRMNYAKAIVHAFWDVYFRDICYEFGYETDNALTVAYNCSDLHKTDQVLGIARADQRQYPPLFIK